MQSTNVDFLLQNYSIAEIQEIEKKLKHDVDKKKDQLKHLIGERYRELIEVADVIEQMKVTGQEIVNGVEQLSTLLDNRGGLIGVRPSDSHYLMSSDGDSLLKTAQSNLQFAAQLPDNQNLSSLPIKDKVELYRTGTEVKTLLSTPLLIWTSLSEGDVVRASYFYAFGGQLCQDLMKSFPNWPLLVEHDIYINSLLGRIEEVARNQLSSRLSQDYHHDDLSVDERTADVLACLLIIGKRTTKELFNYYLDIKSRELSDIFTAFEQDNKSTDEKFEKIGLEFINLLLTTIKVIFNIFYDESGARSLLIRRLQALSKLNYKQIFQQTSSFLSKFSPKIFAQFKISSKDVPDDLDKQSIEQGVLSWIETTQKITDSSLGQIISKCERVHHICTVLQNIDDHLRRAGNNSLWMEACEVLIGRYVPIWETFFMKLTLEHIDLLNLRHIQRSVQCIRDKVDKLLSVEDDHVLPPVDRDVSLFLWHDLNMESSTSIKKKTHAITPTIEKISEAADRHFEEMLKDTQLLKTPSKILMQDEDVNGIWHRICQRLTEEIEALIEWMREKGQDHREAEKLLLLARVARGPCISMESMRAILNSGTQAIKLKENSWVHIHNNLYILSNDLLVEHFTMCIEGRCAEFEPSDILDQIDSDSRQDVGAGAFFVPWHCKWDEISVTEETQEGEKLTSIISVPLQISLPLHRLLLGVCSDINKAIGHTLSRAIVAKVLQKMIADLVTSYQKWSERLQQSSHPATLKQKMALQSYFDILFLRQLVGSSRDDKFKALQPSLSNVASQIESFIDPFDLYVYSPHLHSNVTKSLRSSIALFGLLVTDSLTFNASIAGTISAPNSKNQDSSNQSPLASTNPVIGSFHSCSESFNLLSLSSIYNAGNSSSGNV